jgi:hypothetical protein
MVSPPFRPSFNYLNLPAIAWPLMDDRDPGRGWLQVVVQWLLFGRRINVRFSRVEMVRDLFIASERKL